ncbi:alpha/beta fold hydrolase [Pseudomonas benzenivorans]|uniref:Alpha/beta fold hydrolase n=1 Tax=Pseudomonas benzenivorans TaxID=556533 RepID=A0ABZ0PZ41_9PSED|nr:alpha/beta fold hydrolase [Pseudomonas benzenivorans]WPC06495.1 alpha/beta fold hydrolase [Pseudomonas benzenivorans]
MQLFCLAHAGASAMPYARWRPSLPRWLEVCPLELPGRGARAGEPLQRDFERLLDDLQAAWRAECQGPCLLWGHSLGGLLAFELAHRLHAERKRAPLALFVSACRAPSRRALAPRLAEGSDGALIAALDELVGLPRAVLGDPAVCAEYLPVLRADFALAESYRYRRRGPLPCELHVLGARQDSLGEEELRPWRREARADIHLHWLEGDHFYLRPQQAEVLQLIELHALRLWRAEALPMPLGA